MLNAFDNIVDMTTRSEAKKQNESTKTQWPTVLRMPGDEFQQSFAVAQLAVKLCELKMANSKTPLEKENANPKSFLDEAYELIASGLKRVVRPQTPVEYMVERGDSREALATVLDRKARESMIPFEKLCNPRSNEVYSEPIPGIEWKVYRSKHGFDDLFWKYWRDNGEKWKSGDQEIGTMQEPDTQGKRRRIDFFSETERKELATLARDTDAWKRRGKALLDSWKQNGVPPVDFSALANFRREHDNRAANLPQVTKVRAKRARVVKGRTRKRKRTGGAAGL